MIGKLRGVLSEKGSDGACIIDVQGVGYEVFIPETSRDRWRDGDEVSLYVHTHVREDSLTLYGFSTVDDRVAFRFLLGVSSIGPKLALAILNRLNASELALAVARGDAAAFRGIAGVGKRTVERLMIDLKDKLPAPHSASATPLLGSAGAQHATLSLVSNALVQMGYKAGEAERAVAYLLPQAEGKPVEALLREALASLAS